MAGVMWEAGEKRKGDQGGENSQVPGLIWKTGPKCLETKIHVAVGCRSKEGERDLGLGTESEPRPGKDLG